MCHPCSEAIPNCLVCNGKKEACTQCQPDFYLYSSKKTTVYDQCIPCNPPKFLPNNNVATLSTGKEICLDCSSVFPGCEECNKDGCQKCLKDFYIFDPNDDGNYKTCDVCDMPNLYRGLDEGKKVSTCFRCSLGLPDCESCYGDASDCKQCIFQDPERNIRYSLLKDAATGKYSSCIECLGVENVKVQISEMAGKF
jgi:hypothetical protein